MVRFAILLTLVTLTIPCFLFAEGENDPRIARAFGLQKTMNRAKDHLQANRPGDAVAVLEAEILYVDGNATYLAIMRDAYIAYLKDLKQKNGHPDRIEHVRRQLKILDPALNVDEAVAQTVATTTPMLPPAIEKPRAPVFRAASEDADPFQQAPLDQLGPATTDLKARAAAAFEQKRFADASALYKQVQQAKLEFSAEDRQAWGYCRLHDVVTLLNKGNNSTAAMQKEAEEAIQLGGPPLEKFGQQVLAEIRKRKSGGEPPAPTAVPDGWQTVETGSFRVFFQQSRLPAAEVSKVAEQVRSATFEKWSGPVGSAWSPRCDIWLHASAADYAKATSKPATTPGHASVGIKDGRAIARRIDLRSDDAGLLEITLPRETAYVVLADLFPEQALPRWADVGMTINAEPVTEVSRYLRAVPRLAQEKKLFSVRDLLKMADFPAAEKITAFYVESVSLVDFLVRLKGAKAFALYLREAPRRGYEEALQRHYGFKDANELQDRWLKFAMGGE